MCDNSAEASLAQTASVPGEVGGTFKPHLSRLLQSLCLDVAYESGRGTKLSYRAPDGELVDVLDLIGGYGSVLFGHSHPALVQEAVRVLTAQRPMHAQASIRPYARKLAEALSRRVGGEYCAVFANSGAEAVEAAIKHALLETGGKAMIALQGGFHGKTLGALQLTANPQYREDFVRPGLPVVHVPPNDVAALEKAFRDTADLAGFVFEPVQGEGGVRPLTPEFCQAAAALCAARHVPLIADECQTGVGRTGSFLASEQLGVRPDYIILSKALGGGLAKISALLIDRQRYVDEFDLKHTSTYADDDLSCAVALRVLELLDAKALARCSEMGAILRQGLEELALRFPQVIAEVRGCGLLIGLEFKKLRHSPSLTLRYLGAQNDLVYLVMGYLWHAHRIRVAPTLSDRWTLRLEPPLLISHEEIGQVLKALEDVCKRLSHHDALGLTRFLGRSGPPMVVPRVRSDGEFFAYDEPRFRRQEKQVCSRRVAWLCHFVGADDIVSLEPPLGCLSGAERERYLERSLARGWPIVMGGAEVRSAAEGTVCFYPILLPFTSHWAKGEMERRELGVAASFVQAGVNLARDLRCEVVALGQYTSILTRNGTRLDSQGLTITTGNTYALVLAVQALERAQRKAGRRPADSVLAIVGAGGNIGRAAAEVLAPFYRETSLLGRSTPGSVRRLRELSARVPRSRVTTDLDGLVLADAILVATNAVDAPLGPGHFKSDAIVCDVSVPAALATHIRSQRPDLLLIKGGIAALPHGQDLKIPGFPLPAGQAYGCMAEAMLLGLEEQCGSGVTGPISAAALHNLASLADKHGFGLAACSGQSVFGLFKEKDVHEFA